MNGELAALQSTVGAVQLAAAPMKSSNCTPRLPLGASTTRSSRPSPVTSPQASLARRALKGLRALFQATVSVKLPLPGAAVNSERRAPFLASGVSTAPSARPSPLKSPVARRALATGRAPRQPCCSVNEEPSHTKMESVAVPRGRRSRTRVFRRAGWLATVSAAVAVAVSAAPRKVTRRTAARAARTHERPDRFISAPLDRLPSGITLQSARRRLQRPVCLCRPSHERT